ncbi:initiation factor 3 [Clavulina sp. PMI_390]|nr:initiation factor 3 [Clavulina sp. PMI_390]
MSTEDWTRPSTRPDVIDQLVDGVDRYNPENVNLLEDYLYRQIREQEYDCLANLAILKLYQFNPDLYNPDVVINILIKALIAAPAPDYSLCIALLGERQPEAPLPDGEEDPVPEILQQLNSLDLLLRSCQFPKFWSLYFSSEYETLRQDYTVEVAGFEDSIRDVVVHAVKATFTSIGRPRLESYLNLKGADLQSYLEDHLGWSTSDSGTISIPPNPDNQIKATVTRESIALPQLQKLISHAAKA